MVWFNPLLLRANLHSSRRLRLVVLATSLLFFVPSVLTTAAEPATVQLIVDYGDGVLKQFPRLSWQEKQTVLDTLALAVKHPRGIKVATQGKGELTLVLAIDDLKNEGRGKNWVYRVNGKLADRSCGVFEVQAGDAIEWKFSGEMP